VAFINELATLCERVGADATEVATGLRSDQRIGPRAYLAPGSAFAGGTLARDLVLLEGLGASLGRATPLVSGVLSGNREHAGWAHRTVAHLLGALDGRRVAIWGLTYKPGTSTLRRSPGLDVAHALAGKGASITAFDPAVSVLPDALTGVLTLAADPLAAAADADAVVVATEWPMFRDISSDALVAAAGQPAVVDAARFLKGTLGADPRIRYVTVGTPHP